MLCLVPRVPNVPQFCSVWYIFMQLKISHLIFIFYRLKQQNKYLRRCAWRHLSILIVFGRWSCVFFLVSFNSLTLQKLLKGVCMQCFFHHPLKCIWKPIYIFSFKLPHQVHIRYLSLLQKPELLSQRQIFLRNFVFSCCLTLKTYQVLHDLC